MQALSDEKKALEEEIEIHKGLEMAQLKEDEITDIVTLFEEAVESGDDARIHDMICELIELIEIDFEDIRIHWNF